MCGVSVWTVAELPPPGVVGRDDAGGGVAAGAIGVGTPDPEKVPTSIGVRLSRADSDWA